MKDASMMAVRMLTIAADAILATQRSEVWMVAGEPASGVAPAQAERRIEAVAVVVQGRIAGEVVSISAMREILRGRDGEPTGLRDMGLPGETDGASLGGPMSETLPPERPTGARRVVARAALVRMGMLPAHG